MHKKTAQPEPHSIAQEIFFGSRSAKKSTKKQNKQTKKQRNKKAKQKIAERNAIN